jgi:ABC-2 type transport system ATP-binding protein
VLGLQNVTHRFGDRTALDDVDVVVRPGRLTGLLGPNGAGKTTLMRIAVGVLQPDAGSITFGGQPVTAQMRRAWGYMAQERGLYPAMPVGEQLVHFARLHGLPPQDAERRARVVLTELGLGERWKERTERLSGGQQQRLQLATALVHDPRVIVLDEPFNGLDPVGVAELADHLQARTRAGAIVVVSSHQLDLVQDLCDEIVMIDQGRSVLSGSVTDLRASVGTRRLRLSFARTPDPDWVTLLPGAQVVESHADAIRLALDGEVDPLAVLDAARGVAPVVDFGLELPSLSEVFMTAVGRGADTPVEEVTV